MLAATFWQGVLFAVIVTAILIAFIGSMLAWKYFQRDDHSPARVFTHDDKIQLEKALSYLIENADYCARFARTKAEKGKLVHNEKLFSYIFFPTQIEQTKQKMINRARRADRLIELALNSPETASGAEQVHQLDDMRQEVRSVLWCCSKCRRHNLKLEKLAGSREFDHECLLQRRAMLDPLQQ